MRNYEVMYILNASLEDSARQEVMDSMHAIITNNGGNILNVDEWGLKEFAYPIQDMKKGYYVVLTFAAENDALNEFDRLMHINPNVVRYLVINKDEE